MIQITETAADKAALQIAEVMAERGGQWIVNVVDDEGYVMACVGSRHAAMLERSGSPSLAGPFNARWKSVFIAADLQEAKSGVTQKLAQKAHAAARRMYRPTKARRSRNTVMMHVALALAANPLTADIIAERVGVDEQSVRNALRRLVRTGAVVVRGKLSISQRSRLRQLYEAVA